jgi:quercetin dioxygenase-like cupin family protein
MNEIEAEVFHHFGGGVYVKETHIPAGCVAVQHKHVYDHLSVLVSGRAKVSVENQFAEIEAPRVLTILANKYHKVEAVTDCVWLCVHATGEVEPAKADASVISPLSNKSEMILIAGK